MAEELDLSGMTWYGALVAVVMLMVVWIVKKKRRFNTEGYTNTQIREMVHECIHSERDRAVILRRLCDHKSIERLAEEFFLSDAQIKRIIYKCEDKLARLAEQK